VGTGTGVGKTWVTARLIEQCRADGLCVAVRKPAQSFAAGEATDAEILSRASGERPDQVCPPGRWFGQPLAPPMAAEALGRRPFTIADLAGELAWPDDVDIGFVEGVGGVRSPLAADGDVVDLIRRLGPDVVVLVADPGLGTLNLVRMSVDALAGHRVVVYLNRFDDGDDLHRRNRHWLESRMRLTVETDVSRLPARLGDNDGGMDEAARVYIDAIPPEHRPLFDRLHGLILAEFPDAGPVLSYQMPTYKVGNRRLYVGAWKHGVSIYGWQQDGDAGFTARHPSLLKGKGTIQLRPEDAAGISDDELRGLVRAALEA
jgi:dethiobiotin synthetase